MVKHEKKKSGFTLIEMLVVISVLGILVSLAGHHHTRVLKKSQDASLMLELNSLRNAVHQYALDSNGRFPATLAELKPLHIKNLPAGWRGSSATGKYYYDSSSGQVELYDESGTSPCLKIDHGGRSYADY